MWSVGRASPVGLGLAHGYVPAALRTGIRSSMARGLARFLRPARAGSLDETFHGLRFARLSAGSLHPWPHASAPAGAKVAAAFGAAWFATACRV